MFDRFVIVEIPFALRRPLAADLGAAIMLHAHHSAAQSEASDVHAKMVFDLNTVDVVANDCGGDIDVVRRSWRGLSGGIFLGGLEPGYGVLVHELNLQHADHVFQNVDGGHFFFVIEAALCDLFRSVGIFRPRPIEARLLFETGESIGTGHAPNGERRWDARSALNHGALENPVRWDGERIGFHVENWIGDVHNFCATGGGWRGRSRCRAKRESCDSKSGDCNARKKFT